MGTERALDMISCYDTALKNVPRSFGKLIDETARENYHFSNHPPVRSFTCWYRQRICRRSCPHLKKPVSIGVDWTHEDAALTHEVVDLLQLAHADGLEGSLDETATVEIDGFGGVLSVADVGSFDGDHLDDLCHS